MEAILKPLPHPCGWLHLDALDANITFVQSQCGDKAIRIATKSIRSVDALRYIQQRLPQCSGFMTFTAAETLYLATQGLNDFLIGYPVMEEEAIRQLVRMQPAVRVTFMVDNEAQMALLHRVATSIGTSVAICIDINVSTDFNWLYFGTRRSPLHTIESVQQLLQHASNYPSLRIEGVMAYDAQIAGVADRGQMWMQQAKGKLVTRLKMKALPRITAWRQQAVAHIRHEANVRFVNAGGSGSMAYCATQRDVTEITVGSAFFAPTLFDQYAALHLQPAAGFSLRVTRKFAEDIAVLQGGGYIASGAIGAEKQPQFVRANDYAFFAMEGAGEVQTPIAIKKGTLAVGENVLLRHAKAGELCERFNELHTVRGHELVGTFQTYRGDGQCFL